MLTLLMLFGADDASPPDYLETVYVGASCRGAECLCRYEDQCYPDTGSSCGGDACWTDDYEVSMGIVADNYWECLDECHYLCLDARQCTQGCFCEVPEDKPLVNVSCQCDPPVGEQQIQELAEILCNQTAHSGANNPRVWSVDAINRGGCPVWGECGGGCIAEIKIWCRSDDKPDGWQTQSTLPGGTCKLIHRNESEPI